MHAGNNLREGSERSLISALARNINEFIRSATLVFFFPRAAMLMLLIYTKEQKSGLLDIWHRLNGIFTLRVARLSNLTQCAVRTLSTHSNDFFFFSSSSFFAINPSSFRSKMSMLN